MDSIVLDPKKGVNPALGKCPRCKKDNGEILLLGRSGHVWNCKRCNMKFLSSKNGGRCPKCRDMGVYERELGDGERVASNLCDECSKENDEHRAIVESGGIYFRCKDCGCDGAIKPGPFADKVRKVAKVDAPDLCGVEFTSKDCPKCGPDKPS